VGLNFSDNAARAWVNGSDLLVLASGGEERTVVVPGNGLDDIGVSSDIDLGISLFDIPDMTVKSLEEVASTLLAVGLKLTVPTFLLCPERLWTGVVRLAVRPSSGMCQILA